MKLNTYFSHCLREYDQFVSDKMSVLLLLSLEIFLQNNLTFTNNLECLYESDVFIITVPTPINKKKQPDLSLIILASKLVGASIKENKKRDFNNIIIYESTVYPGTTEDICIPIIEKEAGLFVEDENGLNNFAFGYSPERINPGDSNHTLDSITK